MSELIKTVTNFIALVNFLSGSVRTKHTTLTSTFSL